MDDDLRTILEAKTNRDSSITIGNHVWIAADVKILKGVKIGHCSIIVTGSLVTKDVNDNALVGGIPAKILKENINWK